jgi:hypothetical protein
MLELYQMHVLWSLTFPLEWPELEQAARQTFVHLEFQRFAPSCAPVFFCMSDESLR